jgi:cell division protein FtsB
MLGGRRRRSLHRGATAPKRSVRTAVFLVALSVIGGLVLSLFILQALEIRSLRRELEEINAAQQRALIEQAALRERLAEKDDPEAIEQAARERLGWVMRGEEKVVFIYEEEE